MTAAVGIIANPASGSDVRRLAARATRITQDSKRDQVARAVVGAAASGAEQIFVIRDALRIGPSAVENLKLDCDIRIIDIPGAYDASDTHVAAQEMRQAGCGALVALGGDGTSRAIAQVWPDAPLVPLSTGTNNVFPMMVEATIAGSAAGLVASGAVPLEVAATRAKSVHLESDGVPEVIALVDAVLLEGDRVGNLMPVDPQLIRCVVLARAEPAAVGMSPIGGLLEPCGADDDAGVVVRCVPHEQGGRPLRVPISPGLFRTVHIQSAARLALGETTTVVGPGVLAFDGDREVSLGAGDSMQACVRRDGPYVIDPGRTLLEAARGGLLEGRGNFQDGSDGVAIDCC